MSARKTSSKAKTETAEAEEVKEEAAEAVTEPVKEAEKPASKVKATAAKAEAEKAEPVAYIGPDIKLIAKSGTIYTNGLPEAFTKKIEEMPALSGLIVPVSNLAAAMQTVSTEGTSLNNLFKVICEKQK